MSRRAFVWMAFLSVAMAASGVIAEPSPGLVSVLGTDEASYSARMASIRALSKSLSGQEINELYGFLNRKTGEDKAQPGELNALKNDVVNALKMQKVMPPDLPARLMAMYGDRSHDEVWRDYCIQHLGDIYTAIGDAVIRAKAIHALWLATDEKQGSIPGTGLIALHNLSGQKGFEKSRIAAKALEMVRSPEYGEPAKITALQICAKAGESDVLSDARKLAAIGSIPIRMSAMACLGSLGDKSDLALLKASEGSTDIRLRTAAEAAIMRLAAKR